MCWKTNLLLNKLQELSMAILRPDFCDADLPHQALGSVRLALALNLSRAILRNPELECISATLSIICARPGGRTTIRHHHHISVQQLLLLSGLARDLNVSLLPPYRKKIETLRKLVYTDYM